MEDPVWMSKDRFAAKRLRNIANKLDPQKRAIIEEHSAFSSLLHTSPFSVPNELVDFVAVNTSHLLREFNYRGKRIVFTKEMVSRVLRIRSGNKPVKLLTKSVQSDLRDSYKGGQRRLPIKDAQKMLKDCDAEDEDAIIRTWDLLCFATVLHPGSNNMMQLDYLGSMDDPKKVHEFDWDQHILDLLMHYVEKLQKMKERPLVLEEGSSKFEFWMCGPLPILAIIYMDHLGIPNNEYSINYSLPRICHVTSADFSFIVKIDLNNLILRNKTIFGRRPFLNLSETVYGGLDAADLPVEEEVDVNPSTESNPSASLNEWLQFPSMHELEVPPRFKNIYEKHKVLFATDVDSTLKTLSVGLKSMHSQCLASMLMEVDGAMREGDGPSIVFPTNTVPDCQGNTNVDAAKYPDSGADVDGAKEVDANQRVAKKHLTLNGKRVSTSKGDAAIVGEHRKRPRPTAASTKDGEQQKRAKAVAVKAKEGKQRKKAAITVENGSNVSVQDVPQPAVQDQGAPNPTVQDMPLPAVIIQDSCKQKEATDGEELPAKQGDFQAQAEVALDDGSSKIMSDSSQLAIVVHSSSKVADVGVLNDVISPVAQPLHSTSSRREIPPGFWDDATSFEVWSQGSVLNKIPDVPAQKSEAPLPGVVAATSSADKEATELGSDNGKEMFVPPSDGEAFIEEIPDAATPEIERTTDDDTDDAMDKDASTGVQTLERRTRFKRKAKDDVAPAMMKKIKVSQDVQDTYKKFVAHARTFKSERKKPAVSIPFLVIGRFHCTYRSFNSSLRPRGTLDNQVMALWTENFNVESKSAYEESARALKKYAFSCYFSTKLTVDPADFNPLDLMREFKKENVLFKLFKNDVLYFPVVENHHWIVCSVNILHKQFHTFDSLLGSKNKSMLEDAATNLFMNFVTLAHASKNKTIDWGSFTHVTPDHPQQKTLYDCGFFSMLFMKHFNAKVMVDFPVDDIPSFRMVVASQLIEKRQNEGAIETVMEYDLVKKYDQICVVQIHPVIGDFRCMNVGVLLV